METRVDIPLVSQLKELVAILLLTNLPTLINTKAIRMRNQSTLYCHCLHQCRITTLYLVSKQTENLRVGRSFVSTLIDPEVRMLM